MGRLTSDDYKQMRNDMEERLESTLRRWNRAASPIKDRVLLAKTMALSKLWYMASVMPWTNESLQKIQKMAIRYIWSFKPSKVARGQITMPKDERGLGVWGMVTKVRALNSHWGLAYLTKKMSPDLYNLMDTLCNHPNLGGSDNKDRAPIITSGAMPGKFIIKRTGSKIMGNLMDNWAQVVSKRPPL